MVPVKEPPRSSQAALLELEKGTNAPACQLNEAAQIIGIDLRAQEVIVYGSGDSLDLQPATASAPKEEWVLRWLLKKLKAANGPVNYKLDSDSWLLLRLLLDQIPPKTIAAILNEHKFLGILEKALVDLVKFSAEGRRQSPEERISETPSSKSPKRGQKRKRTDPEEESSDSTITHELSPSSWSSTLLSIVLSIQRLVALSSQSHGVDGTSRSHLKLALKGESQVAASILGMFFQIATSALQVLEESSASSTQKRLISVLPSVFEIWELRSTAQSGSSKNKSNDETLCSSFFSQALQLLTALENLALAPTDKDDCIQLLERAIALQVVLPIRADFFSKHAPGISSIDQKPNMDLVELVSSSFRSSFGDKAHGSNDKNSKPIPASGELLPKLLDIAIRSVPRDTFKRQTGEAPWLETLFIALSELAGCPLETAFPQYDEPSSHKTLENLFQAAIEREISISLKTLSMFTSRFSRLFEKQTSKVAWGLISKILSVDVDVFLPNSGLPDSKPLLYALLGHINKFSLDSSLMGGSSGPETYKTIKSGILSPLIRGFAGARDISTFGYLWYEQLMVTAKQENGLFSVWEDDDLNEAYSIAVSKFLSDDQIVEQAQSIQKDMGDVDISSEVFARIVILDSIASSEMRIEGTTEIRETYQPVLNAITTAVVSKIKPKWQWRLWRLARNILDKRLRWVDTSFSDLESTLVDEATKFFQGLRKGPKSGLATDEYLEALEVFRFMIFTVEKANDSRYTSQYETVIAQVVSFLGSVKNVHDGSTPNGKFQTIDSQKNLAIGYLVTLLSKPDALIRLTSNQRRLVFDEVVSLAASDINELEQPTGSRKPKDSPPISFRRIWEGFVSYRWLLDAQPATYDIIEVLSTRIKADTNSAPFMISSMVNVPARLIPRHLRAKTLDLLQEFVLRGQSLDPKTYIEIFAFMTSLLNQPKTPAQISNDPKVLWKIADSVKFLDPEASHLIRRSFRNLHQGVFDGFLVASDEQRQKYFDLSYKKARGILKKLDTIDYTSTTFFLTCVSLSMQSLHRNESKGSPKKEDIDGLRHDIFELLLKDLNSSRKLLRKEQGSIAEQRLRNILEALEDFGEFAQGNKDLSKVIKKTEEMLETKGLDDDTSLHSFVKRRLLSAQKAGKNITQPLIQCSTAFPVQHLHTEKGRVFFGETRQRLSLMSTDEVVSFIHDIRKSGFAGDDASYRLLLAGMAVACCEVIEERDSRASNELTSLFTAVTESMHGSQSIEQFSLATECLDVLLRTHSRSITQWNVDNVLGAILISMTSSGPQISPDHAGVVYKRLCRLMGTLISLYRRKLGGRFHLVLPVTQGLLRCLFTTNSKQRKRTQTTSKQPPWLESSKSGLTTEHAVQYTRLLTSLCDPTMSAVNTQRGPGSSDLTDPTKKAKRVAGQHLQYLVMEYTHCQLQNSLTPEMKTALMPGLYAVLDVMTKDTMRTMNAAMDSSSRAVFKGLYDDYNKFGKWNKN